MKGKVAETVNNVIDYAKKNEPAILSGIGVAGVFITAWMAFKAGPKANYILEKHRCMIDSGKDKKEETKKAIKELAPVVIPPAAMAVATSVCIIGSNSVSSKRIAVLSAAYNVSESALKEYQNKVTEIVKPEKVKQIKESLAKDELEKNPIKPSTDVIVTGDGDVLCMDCYSGRYFRSNAQKIGQAVNELSADVQTDMYVSLNDFYSKIGIPSIPMGDDFGWNVDDLNHGQLSIEVSAHLTPDKQPCLVVNYDIFPREDYRRLH